MKTTFLFLLLFTSLLSLQAQRLAMAGTKDVSSAPVESGKAAVVPQFVFRNCGIDLNHDDLKDYPVHLLGDGVAKKMFAARKIYVRRYPASVGFTDNTIEIYKPAIYNAITRLDAYFRKAVRRHEMSVQEAAVAFSKCLDVAYLAFYEEQTADLELALKEAKAPGQLLAVFHSILIEE